MQEAANGVYARDRFVWNAETSSDPKSKGLKCRAYNERLRMRGRTEAVEINKYIPSKLLRQVTKAHLPAPMCFLLFVYTAVKKREIQRNAPANPMQGRTALKG